MTQKEQEHHFSVLTNELGETILAKGNDYAMPSDRLSNFKLAGTICGLSAEQQCLSLIATKVARLGVLFNSGKGPNNESIHDSVLDLAAYSILLSMILHDKTA